MKNISLILLILIKYSMELDPKQVFEISEIIPDVLDVSPKEVLQVVYEHEKKVDLGNVLTPTEVKDHPKVNFKSNCSDYYTLLMVDPDAPSRNAPKLREVKHWFVGNIKECDVDKGDHITAYFGSGPPKGTGLHRYIFLLYKQEDVINFDAEPRTSNISRENRFHFNTRRFANKYNLGEPVAGNFFEAQWDKYVDERNDNIARLQEKKE